MGLRKHAKTRRSIFKKKTRKTTRKATRKSRKITCRKQIGGRKRGNPEQKTGDPQDVNNSNNDNGNSGDSGDSGYSGNNNSGNSNSYGANAGSNINSINIPPTGPPTGTINNGGIAIVTNNGGSAMNTNNESNAIVPMNTVIVTNSEDDT